MALADPHPTAGPNSSIATTTTTNTNSYTTTNSSNTNSYTPSGSSGSPTSSAYAAATAACPAPAASLRRPRLDLAGLTGRLRLAAGSVLVLRNLEVGRVPTSRQAGSVSGAGCAYCVVTSLLCMPC